MAYQFEPLDGYNLFRDINLDMFVKSSNDEFGAVYKLRIGTADGDEDPQEFTSVAEMTDYLRNYLSRMEDILQNLMNKRR